MAEYNQKAVNSVARELIQVCTDMATAEKANADLDERIDAWNLRTIWNQYKVWVDENGERLTATTDGQGNYVYQYEDGTTYEGDGQKEVLDDETILAYGETPAQLFDRAHGLATRAYNNNPDDNHYPGDASLTILGVPPKTVDEMYVWRARNAE